MLAEVAGLRVLREGMIEYTQPDIICYYSKDAYEQEADRLKKSALKFGLNIHFYEETPFESWKDGVMAKPRIIRKHLEMFPDRGCLYVDADAEFVARPNLTQLIPFDFGAHWFQRSKNHPREILTGTLWFMPRPVTMELVRLWEEITPRFRGSSTPEQESMDVAYNKLRDRILRCDLGPEYVFIFDDFRDFFPNAEPVIVHHQASRRLRR
jgi:hypothetical protein